MTNEEIANLDKVTVGKWVMTVLEVAAGAALAIVWDYRVLGGVIIGLALGAQMGRIVRQAVRGGA